MAVLQFYHKSECYFCNICIEMGKVFFSLPLTEKLSCWGPRMLWKFTQYDGKLNLKSFLCRKSWSTWLWPTRSQIVQTGTLVELKGYIILHWNKRSLMIRKAEKKKEKKKIMNIDVFYVYTHNHSVSLANWCLNSLQSSLHCLYLGHPHTVHWLCKGQNVTYLLHYYNRQR